MSLIPRKCCFRLSEKIHSVSFTGGEPLLQSDFLGEILPLVKQKGLVTYLETNGICVWNLDKVIKDIDIVSMDIKMPSSAHVKPVWEEHREFLKIANKKEVFVKTVVTNDTEKEDVMKAIEIIKAVDENILLVLQPNTLELKKGVINKCNEFLNMCLDNLKDVRIMPQMHKIVGIK